jgi:tRNA_anti-like
MRIRGGKQKTINNLEKKMGKNLINLTTTLVVVLSFGLGCQMLKSSVEKKPETNTTASNSDPANVPAKDDKEAKTSEVEKADFTVTSEELDKEFNRKGVKSEDLEKYANKIIAVSGRVSMLVTEKKGTTQPWVTLYAPGIGNGVNCYFDDENVDQMKKLTEDKMAKVQGFQDDFIVPEISPMLKHCVVLEAK